MILRGKYDRRRAKELLETVGLGHRLHHKPLYMSGGEQQRVAIAIALANEPGLLLADEPTGSLDSANSDLILQVFNDVRDRYGVTIVIVTHDPSMARAVDRYVEIRDGKTSSESVRRAPKPAKREVAGDGRPVVSEETHEEFTLLDSAGRLQLPADYRQVGHPRPSEALGGGEQDRHRAAGGEVGSCSSVVATCQSSPIALPWALCVIRSRKGLPSTAGRPS